MRPPPISSVKSLASPANTCAAIGSFKSSANRCRSNGERLGPGVNGEAGNSARSSIVNSVVLSGKNTWTARSSFASTFTSRSASGLSSNELQPSFVGSTTGSEPAPTPIHSSRVSSVASPTALNASVQAISATLPGFNRKSKVRSSPGSSAAVISFSIAATWVCAAKASAWMLNVRTSVSGARCFTAIRSRVASAGALTKIRLVCAGLSGTAVSSF